MAEPNPEKRYWDSSAFLARIKREPERADVCKSIIDDARAGRCVLYTSMITLTEVVKLGKGTARIEKESEDQIAAFFRNDYIKLVPVDHLIATRARRFIWDFPWLSARDAIHVATAIQVGAPVIEHYDDDDIGRVGKQIEREKLTGFPEIRHPKWTGQIEMALPETKTVEAPALGVVKTETPAVAASVPADPTTTSPREDMPAPPTQPDPESAPPEKP